MRRSSFHPPALPDLELPTVPIRFPGLHVASVKKPAGLPDEEPATLPFHPSEEARDTLEGFIFQECQERSLLGEVWKVVTPDGNPALAQFLTTDNDNDGDTERKLLRLQREVCHRGLAPFKILHGREGQLVLLTDFWSITLADLFQRFWDNGFSGLPAEELLHHLRMAAITLDTLYDRFRLQHLRLQPRQFLLQDNRVLLTGFGLVELLWLPQNLPVPALNPRYSAPELYNHRRTGQCDQYSLALIYAELRTGSYPLRRPHVFPAQHRAPEDYDLELLSEAERRVLERALSRNPYQRFGNATDMIMALESALRRQCWLAPSQPEPMGPLLMQSPLLAGPSWTLPNLSSLDDFVREVLRRAAPERTLNGGKLEHIFPVPGDAAAFPDLSAFCREWAGRVLSATDDQVILLVPAQKSWWTWLAGRDAGFQVHLKRLGDVTSSAGADRTTEILVSIHAFGGSRRQNERLLAERGDFLLESLAQCLRVRPDQRQGPRHLWSEKLRVCPLIDQFQLAEPIECVAKDISPSGIGFYLPEPLTTSRVYISLPEVSEIAHYAGLAEVVRKQPRGEGWFEIGAVFQRGK